MLNLFFTRVVYLFYPETSSRILEEINLLYTGDYNRLIIIDKKSKLLPRFRSIIHRTDEEPINTFRALATSVQRTESIRGKGASNVAYVERIAEIR